MTPKAGIHVVIFSSWANNTKEKETVIRKYQWEGWEGGGVGQKISSLLLPVTLLSRFHPFNVGSCWPLILICTFQSNTHCNSCNFGLISPIFCCIKCSRTNLYNSNFPYEVNDSEWFVNLFDLIKVQSFIKN